MGDRQGGCVLVERKERRDGILRYDIEELLALRDQNLENSQDERNPVSAVLEAFAQEFGEMQIARGRPGRKNKSSKRRQKSKQYRGSSHEIAEMQSEELVVEEQRRGFEVLSILDGNVLSSDVLRSIQPVGRCWKNRDYDCHSEDEVESFQPPAFVVEGDPDFESGPPEDGWEYLRRVKWEAKLCPKVKVAQIDPKKLASEQTPYMPDIPAIRSCPLELLPSKDWERELLADFSQLRMSLSSLKPPVEFTSRSFPSTRNKSAWESFCFGGNCKKKYSGVEGQESDRTRDRVDNCDVSEIHDDARFCTNLSEELNEEAMGELPIQYVYESSLCESSCWTTEWSGSQNDVIHVTTSQQDWGKPESNQHDMRAEAFQSELMELRLESAICGSDSTTAVTVFEASSDCEAVGSSQDDEKPISGILETNARTERIPRIPGIKNISTDESSLDFEVPDWSVRVYTDSAQVSVEEHKDYENYSLHQPCENLESHTSESKMLVNADTFGIESDNCSMPDLASGHETPEFTMYNSSYYGSQNTITDFGELDGDSGVSAQALNFSAPPHVACGPSWVGDDCTENICLELNNNAMGLLLASEDFETLQDSEDPCVAEDGAIELNWGYDVENHVGDVLRRVLDKVGVTSLPQLGMLILLDEVSRAALFRFHVCWLEENEGVSLDRALWLLALAAVIDKPLSADTSAAFRALLRHCAGIRAEIRTNDSDLQILNVLIIISGRYFGQSEELVAQD